MDGGDGSLCQLIDVLADRDSFYFIHGSVLSFQHNYSTKLVIERALPERTDVEENLLLLIDYPLEKRWTVEASQF